MSGLRLNLQAIKEPLGFIKALEWLTAIFAFASCGGYSGTSIVTLFCKDGKNETLKFAFSYPFRLSHTLLVKNNTSLCNVTVPETHLVGSSVSSSQFFVTVAVLNFFYCMAALVLYLGYMHVYRNSNFVPKMDFLMTTIFAVFWLTCTSAWAKGLQNLKYATGTVGIVATLAVCREEGVACEVTELASMRSLNVSVIFGFLGLILWVSNAWFVYKETRWHTMRYTAHPGQAPRSI
ncbi:synaptophysin-like protein 1 [Paramormyrops kingsleyae]|uniref:Synaptophysin like 1 n=1 Tax=Paramormyrops kingsleyae TaxID=1676925 RepID=A0A3B3TAY7_9TELE|nr:synaptophysin-like protein 1 [Paramormyrops kingsleyae]